MFLLTLQKGRPTTQPDGPQVARVPIARCVWADLGQGLFSIGNQGNLGKRFVVEALWAGANIALLLDQSGGAIQRGQAMETKDATQCNSICNRLSQWRS